MEALLGNKIVRHSKCKVRWFDVHTRCENISLRSQLILPSLPLWQGGEDTEILLSYQISVIQHRTVISCHRVTRPGLIHLVTCNWKSATFSQPSAQEPQLLATTFLFYERDLLLKDSTSKGCYALLVFLRMAYFIWHDGLQVHLRCCKGQNSLLSHGWIILH